MPTEIQTGRMRRHQPEMEQRMQHMQNKAEQMLKQEIDKKLPLYIGDVETMLQRVASYVPLIDNEAIYLAELDTQHKFFLAFTVIGLLMFVLGLTL